jgi:hypothetical protein
MTNVVSVPEFSSMEVEKKVTRGRKIKVVRPRRVDRAERLRDRILTLADELARAGFGDLLVVEPSIKLTEEVADEDPKTGGLIGKVREPLGTYIQRVSVADNFSQRPPFDHAEDPIYRRLIRDFTEGAAMPEAKIAALSRKSGSRKIQRLDDTNEIFFSVIDGLQRLYCYNLAILLTLRREALVDDGILTREAWNYFKDVVERQGDPTVATRSLLKRQIRYEVFYSIDLPGLLHYMVTFNTGQRRMSLPVQLEIMQKPLIDQLRDSSIPVWNEMEKKPGMQRPKDQFSAADLVLATQAFITANAHVTAAEETEKFLDTDQRYLDNVGDIEDVVKTLRRLTTEVHPEVIRVYSDDPNKRYTLSNSAVFLISLAAACGYLRNRLNMTMLDGAIDKLKELLNRPVEDPMKLGDYGDALATITSSRGKAIRRLVYDTFLRFFTGATTELEWLDTARQITG